MARSFSNKLFFFQGYQNTIERSAPSGNISNVPTAAMIAGDWTAYNANCGPRWDPNGAAYASGTVDPATYSPVALAILSRPEFPSGTGPCGDIRWGVRGQQRRQQSVSRVDWQQSDNLSIFGRYLGEWHDRPTLSSPDNLLTFTGASGGTNAVDSTFHSLTGGGTWIVSADTLMSARFSYASTHMRVNGAPFFNPSDVGINQWTGVDRIFNFSVTGEFAFGAGTLAGRDVPQTSFQWGNDWTLNRGNHQFSIGGVFARDDIRSDANTRSVGSTNVRGDFTGEAIGDFFSGVVTDIRQSGPSLLSTHQDYAGLYIQDIWRATPNLTVNLGLRWEPYFPLVWDILGDDPGRAGVRVFRFDKDAFKAGTKSAVFPTGPAGFTFPAQDPGAVSDFDGSAGTFAQYNQWAPRIGLAWDPTGEGRTSIRASYGITYDVLALGAIISTNNTSPWSADINNRAGGTLANPWANLAGFNTSPFPFNWRETPLWSSGSVFAAFSPDGEIDTSYTQSWNLAVQQQIGNDWRLSVTYLGNQTAKLWMIENANAGIYFPGVADATGQCMAQGWTLDGVSPGATCTTGGNLNARRELTLWAKANGTADQIAAATGQFSALDIFRSPSTASYHSMLTSIRGTVGGVTFNANHTWAKCISDRAVTAIANPGQAPIVPETRDRAVCSSDRRHILNMTVVASTPEFANRGVNAVFSDWRLSTIYRVSSGTPMTIDTGRDDLATGNQARGQFADVLSNNIYLNRSGDLGTRYFNPASFARPAGGVVGNGGQFIARGFSNWSLDAALSRTFNVTESQSFEVRAEAFNITNSVRPNNPENTITSSRFGLVRTVQDARVMQFALKWLF